MTTEPMAGPRWTIETVTPEPPPGSSDPPPPHSVRTVLTPFDAFEARFNGPHLLYSYEATLDPQLLLNSFADNGGSCNDNELK